MALARRKAINPPVPWSEKEETLLLSRLKSGKSNINELIIIYPNRTKAAIRSKIRKLRIKHDLFGSSYRDVKGEFTLKVAKLAKPNIVFDAYAGAGHQAFKWLKIADTVYASEKITSKLQQLEQIAKKQNFEFIDTGDNYWKHFKKGSKNLYYFIGDALDAAAEIKVNKIKVDLIDLDTCGSTLPLLPSLLALLKPKHLVITHGEFHSYRFKREDVIRRLFTHKDVSKNPFPMTVEEMGKELDKAVKIAALRAHNETSDSFWAELEHETWLGSRMHGMLRRYYIINKPVATSDCINSIST
jgi:hypothetical protein